MHLPIIGHIYNTPAQRRKRKEFLLSSLVDKLKTIREYNRKHNTNYTYGYFVAYVERGWLKL